MSKNIDFTLCLRDCLNGTISRQQAMAELHVSRMTLYRYLKRFSSEGIDGLVHGLSGKPSNNRKAICHNKNQILNLVRDKYFDCGPTLAAEFLEEFDEVHIHPETLRR